MTRGPGGRYASRDALISHDPVGVTCQRCGTTTEGPIWHGIMTVPTGETYWGLPLNDHVPGVLCLECAGPLAVYGQTCCAWCGRSVCYGGPQSRPRRYCTVECLSASRTARRRDQRDQARQRCCNGCGQWFTAVRKDARYCSPACRQKSYRHRQAVLARRRIAELPHDGSSKEGSPPCIQ